MGWNGYHPKMSKAEAKSNLPPGACKLCIYWERCQLYRKYPFHYKESKCCSRCASVLIKTLSKAIRAKYVK